MAAECDEGGLRYLLETNFSIYVEMERHLKERGWKPAKRGSRRYHALLGDRFGIKYNQLLGLEVLGAKQAVNYFPKTHLLTLKSALVRRIRHASAGAAVPWLPESFILMHVPEAEEATPDPSLPPWKRKDVRQSKDVAEALADRRLFAARQAGEKAWILKPSTGCGGNGIQISGDPSELLAVVDGSPAKSVFVAQEYVHNPLLLPGGRKFDLRCWVLLTAPFEVHLFSEGSLRTSSTEYNDDFTNLPAHVTNHCLQERCADYGKFEEGNEMWYSQFRAFLNERHPGRSLEADVLPQVRQIVLETLGAAEDLIKASDAAQYEPFQLFGYDFLVDAGFKVWLLEVNGSPASAEKWKEAMVADILRLTIDERFPPPIPPQPRADDGPRFELISEPRPSSPVSRVRRASAVRLIVLVTLGAAEDLIKASDAAQYEPFQLFGYDFLVDAGFKVWLLEVNGSPASAEKWKEAMVADILRLTIDERFPPPIPPPAPCRRRAAFRANQ
ncbi:Tubulin glycylase 3B [Diplonema papillatum]|nr:Tubulin glycylase 3B [Diplonema papillatum]